MKRGRLLLVLASLTVLVVAPVSMAMYHQRDPIRSENLQYLKPGMTKAEVENLIGCPPGDYRTVKIARGPSGGIVIPFSESKSHWQSDEHEFIAFWDDNERYLGGAGEHFGARQSIFAIENVRQFIVRQLIHVSTDG